MSGSQDWQHANTHTLISVKAATVEADGQVIGGFRLRLTLSGAIQPHRTADTNWALELLYVEVTALVPNPAPAPSNYLIGGGYGDGAGPQIEIPLGAFRTDPNEYVTRGLIESPPSAQDWNIRLMCDLTGRQLAELERLRGNRDLVLRIRPRALLHVGLAHALYPARFTVSDYGMQIDVPVSRWIEALEKVGYCDYVWLQLPVPSQRSTDARLHAATKFLREARANLLNAPPADVIAKCRKVIDAIDSAGFGGHARDEIEQFVKANARKMKLAERVAVLRMALELFLHPAVHGAGGGVDEGFGRDDAEFALAATIALLQIVPKRIAWSAERKKKKSTRRAMKQGPAKPPDQGGVPE